MDRQFQEFCTSYNTQQKEIERILNVQEQNIVGMNDMFQKVINTTIIPKLKKNEDQVQNIPQIVEARV